MDINREEIRGNLIEAMEKMNDNELLEVYRIYCEYNSYADDYVYRMEDLDEEVKEVKPLALAKKIFFGNFNPEHKYFCFDGNYDLISFNDLLSRTSPIYIPEIADYIIDVSVIGAEAAKLFKGFSLINKVLKEGENKSD